MLIGCVCGGLIEAAIFAIITCFAWLVPRLGLRRRQHTICTTSCQHHKHSG